METFGFLEITWFQSGVWIALTENRGAQTNINSLAILITKAAKRMLSVKRTWKKDVRILRTDVTDIFENTHAPPEYSARCAE